MLLSARSPNTSLYRVEVSGWDENRAFFVENSDLEWREGTGKLVTLSRGLSGGAVIFLRLLQPISAERGNPVAYEAEFVEATSSGRQRFQLRPISARQPEDDHRKWDKAPSGAEAMPKRNSGPN
jgi:hypothetical protein